MAKANQFIQDGKILDYTNTGSEAINYLDIIAGTGRIFIAAETILSQATGGIFAEGVFELPKAVGALTFAQAVYYDKTAGSITATSAGNILAGFAVQPAAAADTAVKVKINA